METASAWAWSTLYASRAASGQQRFDFINTDAIDIAGYRMLQAAGGHGKLQRVLRPEAGLHAVDQSRGKAVTGADTIDDVRDVVRAAEQEVIAVMQARRPYVVRRALRLSQRHCDPAQMPVLAH